MTDYFEWEVTLLVLAIFLEVTLIVGVSLNVIRADVILGFLASLYGLVLVDRRKRGQQR